MSKCAPLERQAATSVSTLPVQSRHLRPRQLDQVMGLQVQGGHPNLQLWILWCHRAGRDSVGKRQVLLATEPRALSQKPFIVVCFLRSDNQKKSQFPNTNGPLSHDRHMCTLWSDKAYNIRTDRERERARKRRDCSFNGSATGPEHRKGNMLFLLTASGSEDRRTPKTIIEDRRPVFGHHFNFKPIQPINILRSYSVPHQTGLPT